MSIYSLFEHFTDDKSINDYPYAAVRLHPDNEALYGKFKTNDLVVITYQGKQTLGVLRFDRDIAMFNKNSIHFNRYQRRDLALKGNEDHIIHLEIKKGNFIHHMIYFLESLSH